MARNIPPENNTSPLIKRSFTPIENEKIIILILGTMPGEKSLALQQYYAHPQNRFWRIIAKITDRPLSDKYEERTALLPTIGVGLWDVISSAEREGSLDNNIKNEQPNDLDRFIEEHPSLEVIAFNGKAAEKLYSKYFIRKSTIHYISLPSTSPANAVFTLDTLYDKWIRELGIYLK